MNESLVASLQVSTIPPMGRELEYEPLPTGNRLRLTFRDSQS